MSKEIKTIIDLYAKEGYVISVEYADAINKAVEEAHIKWAKNKTLEQ